MQPEATLNQLKAALPNGQLPSSYGVYFKNTLVALCHALEDHILEAQDADEEKPLVLVTFQQGKWYLQEAERYWDLAQASEEVAIAAMGDSGFGEHRTSNLENVSLVNISPDDSLMQEWNLIILAPGYAAMVLCHELDEAEYRGSQPSTDIERKFYGLWTFEQEQVEKAAEILIDRWQPYDPALVTRLHEQRQRIAQTDGTQTVDLSGVVSRIVNYLQSSQQQLVTVGRQTRDLWELEGQALRMNRNLAANKLQAFLRMAQKVDENDPTNKMASIQVSALSETLGQVLDLPTLDLRRLRLAGLLFRVGLSEAPSEVFTHTWKQLDAMSEIFWRDRNLIGAQLLAAMPELTPVGTIVRHQLEYWNGSGKPDGLKGEEIPLASRILGLTAYFQELTEPRGHRPALSLGEALEECVSLRGTWFDPALVDALSNVVRLTEMGLMQLPTRPSQQPAVWLEDATAISDASSEVTP